MSEDQRSQARQGDKVTRFCDDRTAKGIAGEGACKSAILFVQDLKAYVASTHEKPQTRDNISLVIGSMVRNCSHARISIPQRCKASVATGRPSHGATSPIRRAPIFSARPT